MEAIWMARMAWAEIAINFALILANISIHLRARRLLKDADLIYQDAMAHRREAEKILEDAKLRHR